MVRMLTQRRLMMTTPTKAMMRRKERSLSPMLSGSWLRIVMSTRGVSECRMVFESVSVSELFLFWLERRMSNICVDQHTWIHKQYNFLSVSIFPDLDTLCYTLSPRPRGRCPRPSPGRPRSRRGTSGCRLRVLNPSSSWKITINEVGKIYQ